MAFKKVSTAPNTYLKPQGNNKQKAWMLAYVIENQSYIIKLSRS